MITRLGASGIPRAPYGSFAGKAETVSTPCYLDTISIMTDDFLDTQAAISAAQVDTAGVMTDRLDTTGLISERKVDTSGAMAGTLDTEGDLC